MSVRVDDDRSCSVLTQLRISKLQCSCLWKWRDWAQWVCYSLSCSLCSFISQGRFLFTLFVSLKKTGAEMELNVRQIYWGKTSEGAEKDVSCNASLNSMKMRRWGSLQQIMLEKNQVWGEGEITNSVWAYWARGAFLDISPNKEMAAHSSILVWRIPWTEEPGRHSPWDCKSWTWLSV